MAGHGLDAIWHHGIPELSVRLGVRHGNHGVVPVRLVESHETGAFPRGESAGITALLPDEDLRTVLVIACGDGPAQSER